MSDIISVTGWNNGKPVFGSGDQTTGNISLTANQFDLLTVIVGTPVFIVLYLLGYNDLALFVFGAMIGKLSATLLFQNQTVV